MADAKLVAQLQAFAVGDVTKEDPQRIGDTPAEEAAEGEEHGEAEADIAEIKAVNAEHAESQAEEDRDRFAMGAELLFGFFFVLVIRRRDGFDLRL